MPVSEIIQHEESDDTKKKLVTVLFLALPVYSADGFSDIDEFDVDCRWSNCWDVFNCSTLTVHTPPLEHYSTKTHGQVTIIKYSKVYSKVILVFRVNPV